MSTAKQIAANRANARKSTGPRTAEGKAAARLNALKHGLFANSPVVTGEDSDHYHAIAHSHMERFQPAAAEEHTLVANLIRNAWLLERFTAIETAVWERRLEEEQDDDHPLARAANWTNNTLSTLQRRIDSAERNYRRDLELLIKLQAKRAQPVAVQNGFVSSSSEVRPEPPRRTPSRAPHPAPQPAAPPQPLAAPPPERVLA